jgi:hypothetical protein
VQVGVARVLACPPLSEEEAFPVLAPNYLGGGSNKFRFSLTQQQVCYTSKPLTSSFQEPGW